MKYFKASVVSSIILLAVFLSAKPVLAAATSCGAGTCADTFTCQPAAFCCPTMTTTCGTNCCASDNCFTGNVAISVTPTCYTFDKANIDVFMKGATKVVCYKMVCGNGTDYKTVVVTAADVTCADSGYTVTDGWDAVTNTCRLAPTASLKLSVDPDPAVGGVPPIVGSPSTYTVDTSVLGINGRFKTLGGITSFIVKTLVGVAGVAFMIMFLIGAFKFVTSQGDKAAVESAKGTMTGAFIGIALAAALFAIMTLLQNVFGVSLLNITV